jgi:phosphomannomutase
VPVSCNTAIEKSNYFKEVIRTKIGSPYVIEAFEQLKNYNSFAGFEANGGFLLGSILKQNNTTLEALPTRDALLPFMVLASYTVKEKSSLSKLVSNLPQRFTSSDRIQEFPRENSLKLIEKGFVKADRFVNTDSKIQYKYLLTPTGIKEKIAITEKFIQIKKEEYDKLQQDLYNYKEQYNSNLYMGGEV